MCGECVGSRAGRHSKRRGRRAPPGTCRSRATASAEPGAREAIAATGVFVGMSSFPADTRLPLTLSEQLDAMLSGWLDRHAPGGDRARPDEIATGVVTVADGDVAQVEAFCARWDLTARRTARGDGRWAVLIIEGRALPVRGFIETTAMYRR
jgi:hypothetical protein